MQNGLPEEKATTGAHPATNFKDPNEWLALHYSPREFLLSLASK